MPSIKIGHSACPHDCPSTCALDVEMLDANRIGRVHGAKDNSYTAGVICAKVARYAERVHHPDRLLKPLVRAGAKGEGALEGSSAGRPRSTSSPRSSIAAEAKYGSETVWPYYYAGTMGLVQRDGIDRLRHAKKYSGFFDSICTNLAWTGYIDGHRRAARPRPARDGEIRLRRDLGHQCGGHAGQCHDPRRARRARNAAPRSSSSTSTRTRR